jgi:hypothetical protein
VNFHDQIVPSSVFVRSLDASLSPPLDVFGASLDDPYSSNPTFIADTFGNSESGSSSNFHYISFPHVAIWRICNHCGS